MTTSGKRAVSLKIPDQELQRRISLYYHNLFQECMSQWFFILQSSEHPDSFTYDQYLQLNLRLQKSLISDFDIESATQSAIDDWKTDLAREQEVKQLDTGPNQRDPGKVQKVEDIKIHFDRLRQFFFDLCVSWCQILDAELFLYFFNGLFLNISKGYHITASNLKPLEEIEILPLPYFNAILEYRQKVQATRNIDKNYEAWYSNNFERDEEVKRGVERNLARIFGEKEWRIYDIWLNSLDPSKRKKSFLKESITKMTHNLNELEDIPKDIAQISRTLMQIEMNKGKEVLDAAVSSPSRMAKEKKIIKGEPQFTSKMEAETALAYDSVILNSRYKKIKEIGVEEEWVNIYKKLTQEMTIIKNGKYIEYINFSRIYGKT